MHPCGCAGIHDDCWKRYQEVGEDLVCPWCREVVEWSASSAGSGGAGWKAWV